MRIAFDGRVLERKMTGVGRYLLNILEEIPSYDIENEYFIFTNHEQNYIKNDFYRYVTLNKPFINRKIFTPLWLNYVLPKQLKKNSIDVIIGSNILVPIRNLEGCKKISIVHDIMPLTHPQFFPYFYKKFLKLYLPDSLHSSDLIITISNTSKKYICEYFRIEDSKVKVVYNTFSSKFRKLSEAELKTFEEKVSLKLPQKFLLYVGVLEKRKNIRLILNIAKRIQEIDKNLKIILAGKAGFGFKEFEKELLAMKDTIIWLNQVNDDELLLLYNKAIIFLFPSFVEGFGLPPIEAMACGTPVIASSCDALTEIIGDAAILIPPENTDLYLEKIKNLYTDYQLYNYLSNSSMAFVKKYSRIKMVELFLKSLSSINS